MKVAVTLVTTSSWFYRDTYGAGVKLGAVVLVGSLLTKPISALKNKRPAGASEVVLGNYLRGP